MHTIPVEGMLLILSVDWFMAQARAMTNMVGAGVATIVVARWENDFDQAKAVAVLDGVVPAQPPDLIIRARTCATCREIADPASTLPDINIPDRQAEQRQHGRQRPPEKRVFPQPANVN